VADTRNRMIDAAVQALRRHGLAGMSFTDVLRDSGAARGAIYHHFPGGKAQLVAEAAARDGENVRAHLATLPAVDPLVVVVAFLDAIRPVLAVSTTGGGCATASITIGDSYQGNTDLQRTAASIFTSWAQVLGEHLEQAGLASAEAADLSTTLVMLLEGAHVLCRAAGTLEPFEQAARTATVLTRTRYGGR
jgi:TetR/AcrR family transcriptional regulator, lmrAB and yxaGH operons repressor